MTQRRGQTSAGKKAGIGCGGCLGVLLLFGAFGGVLEATSDEEEPKAAASASPSPAAKEKAVKDKGGKIRLRDYVGKNLKKSINGVKAAGFIYPPLATDADITRFRSADEAPEKWRICTQDPSPGQRVPTEVISWEVVKTEEKCPSSTDEDDSWNDEEDRDRRHTSGGSSGSSDGGVSSGGSGEDDNSTSGGSGNGDGFTNGGHSGGRWF